MPVHTTRPTSLAGDFPRAFLISRAAAPTPARHRHHPLAQLRLPRAGTSAHGHPLPRGCLPDGGAGGAGGAEAWQGLEGGRRAAAEAASPVLVRFLRSRGWVDGGKVKALDNVVGRKQNIELEMLPWLHPET